MITWENIFLFQLSSESRTPGRDEAAFQGEGGEEASGGRGEEEEEIKLGNGWQQKKQKCREIQVEEAADLPGDVKYAQFQLILLLYL